MSQSSLRSISSGDRWSNILAFAFGILNAALAASTFGGCPSGLSPIPGEPTVGIPMSFGDRGLAFPPPTLVETAALSSSGVTERRQKWASVVTTTPTSRMGGVARRAGATPTPP